MSRGATDKKTDVRAPVHDGALWPAAQRHHARARGR
jgi:hypothetical protein